jgi:site-specific DNA-methyltransferase (adenine-specific)
LSDVPEESVDFIWTDPPYFLSRKGGTTTRAGKTVSVHKGDWDVPTTFGEMVDFNTTWLQLCAAKLKPTGTIMATGTMHNIYSVGFSMQLVGLTMLNDIVWEKVAPSPNTGCRALHFAHETILWARKAPRRRTNVHFFDYSASRKHFGVQLRTVWRGIGRPANSEYLHGKHNTQKPIALVRRCLSFAAPDGGTILDPFNGHGTTGVASMMENRGLVYVGVEKDREMIGISKRRIVEARNVK